MGFHGNQAGLQAHFLTGCSMIAMSLSAHLAQALQDVCYCQMAPTQSGQPCHLVEYFNRRFGSNVLPYKFVCYCLLYNCGAEAATKLSLV